MKLERSDCGFPKNLDLTVVYLTEVLVVSVPGRLIEVAFRTCMSIFIESIIDKIQRIDQCSIVIGSRHWLALRLASIDGKRSSNRIPKGAKPGLIFARTSTSETHLQSVKCRRFDSKGACYIMTRNLGREKSF